MRCGISGVDAPPPVIGCAEQSREAGAAVETRPTQPVDGPVTGNESGARAVSYECVVFDGERQVGLRGCVGTGALRGNDVRLLVLQSPPDPRERWAPSPGACNTSRRTSAVAIVLTRPEIPMATRIVRTSPISACSASNTVRSNHQGGLGRRHRGPTSAPCRGGASGESCHLGTTTSRLGSAAECRPFCDCCIGARRIRNLPAPWPWQRSRFFVRLISPVAIKATGIGSGSIRSHSPSGIVFDGDEGRLSEEAFVRDFAGVHHRLRLLTFPMRAGSGKSVPGQTRDLPGSDTIPLHVMWP